MTNKNIHQFLQAGIVVAIVFSIAACNGNESSTKNSTDSVTNTSGAAAVTDSASSVKKAKKKKGQASVLMTAGNTGKIQKDAHGVYNGVEVAPEFPGGQTALANYMNNHLTYPQSAIDNDTSGTVHISFVVDEHGKVIDVKPVDAKNVGTGLTDETVKVFSGMPLWTPGMVHGKKVKTRLELPVTFQIADAN